MPRKRTEIPELEKQIRCGQKKFVSYKEGAQLYSVGENTFREIAKEAGAIYHVKRRVLVNTNILDEYLETYRDEPV